MSDSIFDEFQINDIDIGFVERMLKSLPSNIYFKDMEGKYVFCTHYWNHLETEDNDPNWTIRGKYDIDIRKDRENAIKAMEEDQRIIKTQEGSSYEIKTEVDGQVQYLQLIKNPVFDSKGTMIGIVGLINDITQQKVLEHKLSDYATRDWLTGLRNRLFLDKWLDENVKKDIYPFSVVLTDCNRLKHMNDEFGHAAGDIFIIKTANTLENELPDNSRVIRMGGDEFLSLLPNSDSDDANAYMERVNQRLSQIRVYDQTISASMGCATTSDPNFNMDKLTAQADAEMYKRKKEFHSKT